MKKDALIYILGLMLAIIGYLADDKLKSIADTQKEIKAQSIENFKEISGLSARIAKVEP